VKKNQITQDMGLHNTRLQVVARVIHNNLLILVTDMEEKKEKKEKEGAVCAAAIIQITYQQLI
jgi:hypothetical protein